MSINQIAQRLAVHPNTVRFHLDALLGSGQVERVAVPPRTAGRPPLFFRAARRMAPDGPRQYRLLAAILVRELERQPDPRRRAIEAGRSWAHQVAATEGRTDPSAATPTDDPVDGLVGLLDELGFAPQRTEARDGSRIELRHCPFLELVEDSSEIICAVHLGLMQGSLQASEAPVGVDRLDPFVQPDRCVAHLETVGTPISGGRR